MSDKIQGAFVAWFGEVVSMVRELEARRKFDDDVAAFLKEKKLTRQFEKWRAS